MSVGRAACYRWLVTTTAGMLLTMTVLQACGVHMVAQVAATEDGFPVRLVGGDSLNEGRVEILFNGQWGTVSDVGWDPADASVVCRQLGLYGHSTSIGSAYFGKGTGPVLMEGVQCNGSESRLTDCAFTGWGVLYSHVRDSSVWCQIAEDFPVRIVNGTSRKEGIVEINFRGHWRQICDFSFQASSGSVVCRELGFHGPNVSYMISAERESRIQTCFANNFVCKGDERALADCTDGWKTVDYSFTYAVVASCQIEDEAFLSVQLTGGLSSNQGRLEVYFNGVWGDVNKEGWNDAATSVVCRQLGFFGPNVTVHKRFFGHETGKTKFVGNVDCKGDETELADCKIDIKVSEIQLETSVGIVCQAVDEYPLRLAGSNSSRAGRIEVFFNGHWVPFCGGARIVDRGFARAVCNQLGFSGKSFPAYAHLFENEPRTSDQYASLEAPCTGSESRLVDCASIFWGVFPCPFQTAGVLCENVDDVPVRLVNGSSSAQGRVEILLNDRWSTICNNYWNASAASVVCRQLGYSGRNFSFGVDEVHPSSQYVHRVDCNGQEERLTDCTFFPLEGYCPRIAGVMCQSNGDFPVRLVGGASSREGRVEILFNSQWGTVCDQNWDEADASVVCRQLGFDGAYVAVLHSFWGAGDGPVHMINVNCSGNEEQLADCTFPTWGEFQNYYCRVHVRDAGVICSADEDFPIRLVGGKTSKSGRVELYFHGEWGSVSDYKWDAADARVVCRQLGFDGRSEAVAEPIFGQGQGPLYLAYLTCFGNESRLVDCLRGENRSIGRWFRGRHVDAGVICQSEETFPVRLLDGFSDQSGRVEILFNGQWGTICTLDWDIRDATVVCNQMGFNGAEASVYNSLFGSGSGPVYMNHVDCVGNESMLADCRFKSWGKDTQYCFHHVGVICNADMPKATRNCSSSNLQGEVVWENNELRSCRDLQNVSSLENISLAPKMKGNVTEVSRFLVEMKSLVELDNRLSSRTIEELSEILHSIVSTGAGEPQVTDAVIDVVNKIVSAFRDDGLPKGMQARNITSIVRLVEAQVSSSLRQEGQVSVQKDFIHVEAVSLDFSQIHGNLTLATFRREPNVSNPGRREPHSKGAALIGVDFRMYQGSDVIPNDGVIAAASLPEYLDEVLQAENGNKTPPMMNVSFIMYADDTLFPSARMKRTNSQNGSSSFIPGPVISLNILGVVLVNLTQPIAVEFQVQATTSKVKTECVFWDFSLEGGVGDWSDAGCDLHAINRDQYKCLYRHATNFALLLKIQEELKMHQRLLNPIAQISCIVSSGAYIILLAVYLSVRKLRASVSSKIHIHLLLSLLMLYLVFAMEVKNAKDSTYGCVVVAALLQYLPLTAMTWTAVEAQSLHTTTLMMKMQTACPYYMITAGLVAWGFPLIVTGITLAFGTEYYGKDDFCILAPSLPMYLSLVLPLCVVLGHNIITFCAVTRLLRKASKEHPFWHLTGRLGNDKTVCTLVGVTLAMAFLSTHHTSDTFPVIFCVTNCIQVLAVCCMFRVHAVEGQENLVPRKGDDEEQADKSRENSPAAPGNVSIPMVATPSPKIGKVVSNEANQEIRIRPSIENLCENLPY